MRSIKFKAQRTDGMGWVVGYYYSHIDSHRIVPLEKWENSLEINPYTLCQFTGLYDKNGKEIWEGDYNEDYEVVMWCENRHGWSMNVYDHPTNDWIFCHCYNCEGNYEISECIEDLTVIGNIHNKEST